MTHDSNDIQGPRGDEVKAYHDTPASPQQVWSVLADGWLYPSWVVGASRIRAVDTNWPAVGSRIHHSVGLWPLLLDDHTRVLAATKQHEVRLLARAWPFGEAEVVIRLHPREGGCRIEMIEEATSAPMRWVPQRAQRLAILPRNLECARRLALLAERSHQP